MKKIILCLSVLIITFIISIGSLKASVNDTDYYYDTKLDIFAIIRLPDYYWIKLINATDEVVTQLKSENLFTRVTHHEFLVHGDSTAIVKAVSYNLHSIQPLYRSIELIDENRLEPSLFDTLRIINNMIYIQPVRGMENQVYDWLLSHNIDTIECNNLYWVAETKLGHHSLHLSQQLVQSGMVKFAWCELYGKPKLGYVPPDPFYSNQFYLKNTGQAVNGLSGLAGVDINVEPAWDLTIGDPSIKIAVIDEGVSQNHPDLPISKQITAVNWNTPTSYFRETNAPGGVFDPNWPAW